MDQVLCSSPAKQTGVPDAHTETPLQPVLSVHVIRFLVFAIVSHDDGSLLSLLPSDRHVLSPSLYLRETTDVIL